MCCLSLCDALVLDLFVYTSGLGSQKTLVSELSVSASIGRMISSLRRVDTVPACEGQTNFSSRALCSARWPSG